MQQRAEAIEIPDSDSAEQDEPQPNSPEMTTTPSNTADDTDRTEPQPTTCPHTEEPALAERNEPTETGLTTQYEDDNIGTHTTAEQGQDVQQSNKD